MSAEFWWMVYLASSSLTLYLGVSFILGVFEELDRCNPLWEEYPPPKHIVAIAFYMICHAVLLWPGYVVCRAINLLIRPIGCWRGWECCK